MATSESEIDIWGMQIIHIFRGDWTDCREASPKFLVQCNGLNIAKSEA